MGLLGIDDVLPISDREYVDVEVEEWQGTVRLAVMSAAAREEWEDFIRAGAVTEEVNGETRLVKLPPNATATLIALCWIDEEGRRITDKEKVAALGEKSRAVLERLYRVAAKLNALREEDAEQAEKN